MTRSHKIAIMKKLNLLLIILIFAAILVFVHTGGYNERVRLVAENPEEEKQKNILNDEVYIKHPTLHQYDAKKGQYTITALEGIQNKSLEIISLSELTMDYLDPEHKYWFRVAAGKGELSMKNKQVEAANSVKMYILIPDGNAVDITTETANFDQEKSVISIPAPIKITFLQGELTASSMQQSNKIIQFSGRVKVRLFL
jgi:LPS export ABC transporter protein LptC